MTSETSKNDRILEALKTVFSQEDVLSDPQSLQHYGQDLSRVYPPNPLGVVFPRSAQQLQALVRLANQNLIGLVPSGGRTGLSGGAVALKGELVVSFDRMNQIRDFNAIDQTLIVEAGVITAQVQAFAKTQGLYYPVNFASAGTSQIGGNIATNAGGIKVIRYGLTRDWVAGLEVVTGAGELLQLNQGLVKNATGYDLRHLFIGSEGTLGFISAATLKLTRQPVNLKVILLGIRDLNALMQVLALFRSELELTAFEFFSERALDLVITHRGHQRPFNTPAPWYALLEFDAAHGVETDQALALFDQALDEGWLIDGVISSSQTQAEALWALREDISETIAVFEPYKNDISVTVSKVPAFLARIEQLITEHYSQFEIAWYGHIGDGNLHLNILKPEQMESPVFQETCSRVSEEIFSVVQAFSGSISAEHGVGLLKRDAIQYSRSAAELAQMRAIKKVFDPNGIMNPGKLLPEP